MKKIIILLILFLPQINACSSCEQDIEDCIKYKTTITLLSSKINKLEIDNKKMKDQYENLSQEYELFKNKYKDMYK